MVLWKEMGNRKETKVSTPAAPEPEKRSRTHFGTGAPSMKLTPVGSGAARPTGGNGVTKDSSWSLFSDSMWRAAFDPGGREQITQPYEENIWVHDALDVKGTAVASVPFEIWRDDSDESEQISNTDEVSVLFNKPNPMMSASKFWKAHLIHRHLDGEDFWFMTDREGKPIEQGAFPAALWPIRGNRVEVADRAGNGIPTAWKYTGQDGKPRTFPAHAVAHFAEYDPNDMTRGLGTVEVLARTMELQFNMERYQSAVLRNSGDPGGVIKYKKRIGNREEVNRLEQEVEDLFSNPDNRGRHMILDEDADYIPNKLSPKDMEYQTLWSNCRDTILGSLGVPPILVGVYDRATYNNIVEAKRDLWLGGLGVLTFLTGVERDLDSDFWPLFKDPVSRYVGRFNPTGVDALSIDNLDKLKEARDMVRSGTAITYVEAFALVGLDIDPPRNADVAWIDPKLIPLGEVVGGEEGKEISLEDMLEEDEPADEGDAPEETPPEEETPPSSGDAKPAGASLSSRGLQGDEERAAFLIDIEERYYAPNDARIFRSSRKFLRAYRSAQIRRIEAVARGKKSADSILRELGETKKLTLIQIANALLLPRKEWTKKMKDELGPALNGSWKSALEQAVADIGGELIKPTSPLVIDMIRSQGIKLAEGVTSSLAKSVKAAIIRALQDADISSIQSIQAAVAQELAAVRSAVRQGVGTIEARALRIARTESARAANGARFVQMGEAGVQEHEWVSSKDSEVRHSHATGTGVDGQIRKVGRKFSNGLLYPNDPDGDASEVVNCRCSTRGIVN